MKLQTITVSGDLAVITERREASWACGESHVSGYICGDPASWVLDGREITGAKHLNIPISPCPECAGNGYLVVRGNGITISYHEKDCPRCGGLGVIENWRITA